ncbi:MAG TPA: hypothetical protein VIG24_15155 [Acidimicrobiia bacterium]
MDEAVPYVTTLSGELHAKRLRIAELEHMLRHFDRTSMDLHHYVRAVEGEPTPEQWQIIREQIAEMVDAYGPRNPHR